MDITILIILFIGITSIIISWMKSELNCPAPKVIYRYVPKHTLDVQFGEENYPSDLYYGMFHDKSVYIGGYDLPGGRPLVVQDL